MKKDIQRDMTHLYALLDQCTDEDILQETKGIKKQLVEVNIIEASRHSISYQMNQQTKHCIHKTILLNLKTVCNSINKNY